MNRLPVPKFSFEGNPYAEEIQASIASQNLAAVANNLERWQAGASPDVKHLLASLACFARNDQPGALAASEKITENPAMVVVGHLLRGYYTLSRGNFREVINHVNAAVDIARSDAQARYADLLPHIVALEQNLDQVGVKSIPSLQRHRKIRRSGPLVFVVSYPRSGNTLIMNSLKYIFDTPAYSVFPGDGRYFPAYAYDQKDASLAVVKDHMFHIKYDKERTVVLIRDGRDSMISLFQFLLKSHHAAAISKLGSFADFLKWSAHNYEFGFWGDNVALAAEAKDAGSSVFFSKYEDFTEDSAHIMDIARFIAPDHIVHSDADGLQACAEKLKQRLKHNPEWGFSETPKKDSFVGWFENRGKSNWRDVFDAPAKRAFHEMGGTEFLLRFGYESDSGWWRTES